jgi:hypothetical protein
LSLKGSRAVESIAGPNNTDPTSSWPARDVDG